MSTLSDITDPMELTLQQCDSTNTEMKRIIESGRFLPSGSTVRAIAQTAGRGQRGNSWEAEPGKNLTFSILLRPGGLLPKHHFLVSEAIAIATASFLAGIIGDSHKDTVKIKWPNDIYFGDRKIAGILIENSLGMSGQILQTIAGIGININQQTFSDSIPNPISVRNIIGSYLDLDTLMPRISRSVTAFVDSLAPIIASGTSLTDFESMYHSWLWRADGFYNWRDTASGEIFSAKIDKVMSNGQIILRLHDDNTIGYMFKEVEAVI